MKYKKIGIICAMEKEAKKILSHLLDRTEEPIGSLTFYRGFLGEKEVILSVCGIGKVFAAMCAQTMILRFAPECIINSGVAGSLSAALEILDVAVSENLVQHDMDTSLLGDPVGMISGINKVYLPASPDLVAEVEEKAKRLGIRAVRGTVATGDQFIGDPVKKEKLRSDFSPIACEMEGGAIAQVAYVNRVPFCAIRAISDSFRGNSGMEYSQFAEKASDQGAELLLSLLEE